ncbi:hypothetical protein L6452_07453 [Arctium lappa]|uniref:Uncharacterized protein n=1 Tax=Arctium lappa TaxID=4217 RepID=A0ACB9EL48_ARCLA|nr:hypothetical protein L6452_07453 [Arctium lappa]
MVNFPCHPPPQWFACYLLQSQIQYLEEIAETLRERGSKLYKGCRKYTALICGKWLLSFFFGLYREGLGEAYDRDLAFSSSLENFGGGPDPVSLAFGDFDVTDIATLDLKQSECFRVEPCGPEHLGQEIELGILPLVSKK